MKKILIFLLIIMIFTSSSFVLAKDNDNLKRLRKNLGLLPHEKLQLDENSYNHTSGEMLGIDSSIMSTYYDTPSNYHTNVYVDAEQSNEIFHESIDVSSDQITLYVTTAKLAAENILRYDKDLRYTYYLFGEFDNNIGVHEGIDVRMTTIKNFPVYAISEGIVTYVGGSYGKIAIYDSNTDETTFYLHCQDIDVTIGQEIKVGDYLANQGKAGANIEHVHFQVQKTNSTIAYTGKDLDLRSESPYSTILGYLLGEPI